MICRKNSLCIPKRDVSNCKKHTTSIYMLSLALFVICFFVVTILLISVSLLLRGESLPQLPNAFNADEVISDVLEGTSNPKHRKLYVLLDAGHGGEDGGAVSTDGKIVEKNINLDITRRLSALLALTDYTPIMTREDDSLLYESGQENRKKFYDITNRINLASEYDNAVFVSIHQNKFPIRKYSGFQVYYSPNDTKSSVLAECIQSRIKSLLQPENNRMTKAADKSIRLLYALKCPAVLAECGFLSNESEAALLDSEEYRSKLAYLIFSAVTEFAYEYEEYAYEK